jgi:hypothetical protein
MVLERIDRGDESELQLDVVMAAGPEAAVCIRFEGVHGLRFLGTTTELTELVVLLAEDVSEQQWQNTAYRVTDAEEEVLSFMCARISSRALASSENRAAEET